MEKENDGQTLREYNERKKRYRRRRVMIFAMIMLVAAGLGGIYLVNLYSRTYESYHMINSVPNTEENLAGYLEYGGEVVRYSKDGAVAVDSKGNLLWNGSYEMQDPIADVCKKYIAVADRGGRQVRIYNEEGEAGSFSTLYDITKIQVASQGVTAVLMEEEELIYIQLFDKEGKNLVEKIIHVSKDGFPMDIAISEDGKKLATVFLSVNKGQLDSWIVFYNFDEVGQNLVDNLAGAFNYKDIIIPKITFLNNDMVCAFKENGLIIYDMPEIPEFIKEETVEQKIKSVLHNSKYTGLVLEGEETDASRLILYDLEGKKVLDKKLDFDYDVIFLSGEEIILHDNITCLILKANGKEKFRGTFTTNISAIYPANYLDRYILVTAGEISDIQLLE